MFTSRLIPSKREIEFYILGIWSQRDEFYASYLTTHGGYKTHWKFHAFSWSRVDGYIGYHIYRYIGQRRTSEIFAEPPFHSAWVTAELLTWSIANHPKNIVSISMNEFKIKLKTYSIMSNKILYIQQRAIAFFRNREDTGKVSIRLASPHGWTFLTKFHHSLIWRISPIWIILQQLANKYSWIYSPGVISWYF